MFTSRKFWALIVGLVLLVIGAFFPGFPDIETYAVEIAALVSAYIVGTAIDPRSDWKNKLLDLFKSRKFWATVAGLLFVLVKQLLPDLPFSEDQVTTVVVALSAYIFGTGLQDNLKGVK